MSKLRVIFWVCFVGCAAYLAGGMMNDRANEQAMEGLIYSMGIKLTYNEWNDITKYLEQRPFSGSLQVAKLLREGHRLGTENGVTLAFAKYVEDRKGKP